MLGSMGNTSLHSVTECKEYYTQSHHTTELPVCQPFSGFRCAAIECSIHSVAGRMTMSLAFLAGNRASENTAAMPDGQNWRANPIVEAAC